MLRPDQSLSAASWPFSPCGQFSLEEPGAWGSRASAGGTDSSGGYGSASADLVGPGGGWSFTEVGRGSFGEGVDGASWMPGVPKCGGT